MIPFQGLLFFYVMGLLLLPAIVLGLLEKPLKYYGFFFTVTLLSWVFGSNGQLHLLVVFYLWQMGLFWVSMRFGKKSKWTFRLMVLLAMIPLAAVKIGEIDPNPRTFQLLGISYMTFRSIQVLIDICDDKLKQPSLFDLSYFLVFFPSVSSGPIDRYHRFQGDLTRNPTHEEYLELFRRGVSKLMFGTLSCFVISGLIQRIWLEPLPEQGLLATISYMYGYTFYLFFNFAGYSSMAIGTSYILGISLPENFNMPFLSVDMKDFWSRWHISLSGWLRDYVYSRFVMESLKKQRFRGKRTASYIGYILTMMTIGIWHGLTPAYLIYGAYHALLMCVNEALDLHWKPFRKMKQQGWTQVIMVVVTFHLFSFGLLIFSGRLFA